MKKIFILLGICLFSIKIFAIPCVIIKWNSDSTEFTVANWNYNPSELPVIGLTPGLEVLVKEFPFVKPEYEPRLMILSTVHSVSDDYHMIHTTNRMWIESYELIDRSISDKIASVTDAENWANYQVFPTEKQIKYSTICIALIAKIANGLTISAAEQEFIDLLSDKALYFWQNHINAQVKIDSLNAGAEVDLDSDWINIDPEYE